MKNLSLFLLFFLFCSTNLSQAHALSLKVERKVLSTVECTEEGIVIRIKSGKVQSTRLLKRRKRRTGKVCRAKIARKEPVTRRCSRKLQKINLLLDFVKSCKATLPDPFATSTPAPDLPTPNNTPNADPTVLPTATPALSPTLTAIPTLVPPTDDNGWTEFNPTALDLSSVDASDHQQPGTRIMYISKKSSPVDGLWSKDKSYEAQSIVVYPIYESGINGPHARYVFWQADGTQVTGIAPGLQSSGWTAVPDPGVVYYWSGTHVVDANGNQYGTDPLHPEGITSFYSYGNWDGTLSVHGNLRFGYPDWMLFKRGESWIAGVDVFTGLRTYLEGPSKTEYALHGAYGDLSLDRPLLLQHPGGLTDQYGNTTGFLRISFRNSSKGNIAFSSLHIEALDPSLETRHSGYGVIGWASDNQLIDNILFEDMKFNRTNGNAIQWIADLNQHPEARRYNLGVTMKRCVVSNVWNPNSHNQGLYISRVHRLTVDESIFAKNGYKGDPLIDDTRRDIYSRNFYLGSCEQLDIEDNTGVHMMHTISFNGGSGGPQFRCGGQAVGNLFLNEGYTFFGAESNGHVEPWSSAQIGSSFSARDNVYFKFRSVGTTDDRSHPGWGWAIQSGSFEGEMTGNIVSGQHMLLSGQNEFNTHAYRYIGSEDDNRPTRDNTISDNISFYAGNLSTTNTSGEADNAFINNAVLTNYSCTSGENGSANTQFSENRCHADLSSASNLESWPEPTRSAKTYMEALGYTVISADGTKEFMAEAVKQRKGYWREEFTTKAFVNYIREGFGLPKLQ